MHCSPSRAARRDEQGQQRDCGSSPGRISRDRPLHHFPSTHLAKRATPGPDNCSFLQCRPGRARPRMVSLWVSCIPRLGGWPIPHPSSLVPSHAPGASAAGDPSVLLFRWRVNLHRRWPSRRSKKKGDRVHRQTRASESRNPASQRGDTLGRASRTIYQVGRSLNAPTSPLFLFACQYCYQRDQQRALARRKAWIGMSDIPISQLRTPRDGNLDEIRDTIYLADPP